MSRFVDRNNAADEKWSSKKFFNAKFSGTYGVPPGNFVSETDFSTVFIHNNKFWKIICFCVFNTPVISVFWPFDDFGIELSDLVGLLRTRCKGKVWFITPGLIVSGIVGNFTLGLKFFAGNNDCPLQGVLVRFCRKKQIFHIGTFRLYAPVFNPAAAENNEQTDKQKNLKNFF